MESYTKVSLIPSPRENPLVYIMIILNALLYNITFLGSEERIRTILHHSILS
jgi:hypothetical protein